MMKSDVIILLQNKVSLTKENTRLCAGVRNY
jgi:hypothetical protein